MSEKRVDNKSTVWQIVSELIGFEFEWFRSVPQSEIVDMQIYCQNILIVQWWIGITIIALCIRCGVTVTKQSKFRIKTNKKSVIFFCVYSPKRKEKLFKRPPKKTTILLIFFLEITHRNWFENSEKKNYLKFKKKLIQRKNVEECSIT